MNPKQKRFADEYLIDLNATAAYKRAGYNSKGQAAEANAARLISKDKVAHYVKSELAKRSEDLGIDQKYVLTVIKETVDRCRQARPVLDKKGNPIMVETPDGELAPAFVFDATNVIKGSELLGRHVGIKGFVKETDTPPPPTIDIRVIMDEKMLEAARRIAYLLARGSEIVVNPKRIKTKA